MMADLTPVVPYGVVALGDDAKTLVSAKGGLFSIFLDPRFLQGVLFGIIVFYLIMYYNSRKRFHQQNNYYYYDDE
ncbi:hypothetical protein YYG_01139 [Plasmodium vinckei petteri]|uniref:Uncharacterized protein n=1 Tax=Plasmodium vinckei petteri TaxID=138298 RepID=W7ARL3_PLAVN|nr:hypothetical protein YYG_01139 [Plasmodium vinckei petteri]CAD2105739.1 conserved Plasmodium protein, unknown function [Plasmodium vinckei petteri]